MTSPRKKTIIENKRTRMRKLSECMEILNSFFDKDKETPFWFILQDKRYHALRKVYNRYTKRSIRMSLSTQKHAKKKKKLLDRIIYICYYKWAFTKVIDMRKCRNWQTSKTKDLVLIASVWVQVPSSAFLILKIRTVRRKWENSFILEHAEVSELADEQD